MKLFYYIILFSLFLNSCQQKPDYLEEALQAAGENRQTLEKVLEHYGKNSEDSLKYRAARFLIENMKYKYTIEVDSNGLATEKPDLHVISDTLLFAHIDNAFLSTNYPWSNRVSFPDFCEYILPYRLSNEPLENWMPIYRDYLAAIIDSLTVKNLCDSAICDYLISTQFTYLLGFSEFETELPPSALLGIKGLGCTELAMLGRYVMQTLGIPVAWDFTPHYGNRSLGHDWNLLLSRNIPFLFVDKTPFGEHLTNKKKSCDKMAKVYRKTFEIQYESLYFSDIGENIPPLFNDPYIKDVSHLYFKTHDVEIKLTIPPPAEKKIAYIMVFDNQNWQAIHWAKIKRGKATFTKMASECMYMAMYYHNYQYYPASEPFYINDSSEIVYQRLNLSKQITMDLYRKYPDIRMRLFCEDYIGGIFHASNHKKIIKIDDDLDFSDMDTLYIIETAPEVKWNDIRTNNPKKYRYVRYWAGPEGWRPSHLPQRI